MPEYLRALLVILVLATVVFALAKAPATAMAMSAEDFVRRRNVWYLITLAGYLSQSYWIFTLAVVVVLAVSSKSEKNKVALFFFILLAIPLTRVEIPGFAGIRYFLAIDYLRIITVMLLLPVALECRRQAVINKHKATLPDIILTAYIFYNIALTGREGDFIAIAREAIGWLLDVAIPYYAVSRYVKDIKAFHDVLMSLVMASMVSALLAIFEISRSWMLYDSFADALSLDWTTGYLQRGDFVRAVSSSSQAIVLGYVLAIALGLYLYFYNRVGSKWLYFCGFALLAAGEIAPLSKGPWLGFLIIVLIFTLTGPAVVKGIRNLSLLAIPLAVFLLATDSGEKVVSYLPFMGDLDESSISFRINLFDVSMNAIYSNPLFGSVDFLSRMEDARNGEGLIDVVNHYIGVTLYSGFLGLSLFVVFFIVIFYQIYKKMGTINRNDDVYLLGRVLTAVLLSALFMITAVSAIYHVPIFYYTLAALCVGYVRMPSQNKITPDNSYGLL